MTNIFTYGSLMFPEVIERVVHRHYQHLPAQVSHYRRSTLRNHSYPVVVPDRQSPPLAGTLYVGVNARDLCRLDHFEGDYYQRQQVTAWLTEQQQPIQAQLYVLKPCYRHLATGREWSAQRFERDHLPGFISTYCRAPC